MITRRVASLSSRTAVLRRRTARTAATGETSDSVLESEKMESAYVEWNVYAQDMLNGMLLSESRAAAVDCSRPADGAVVVYAHLPPFRRQSPQFRRRPQLVQWTCAVANRLGLATATIHLTIKIIDLFMDGHDIEEPQLYLVCLTALMLASKFEEKDSHVPKASILNTFLDFKFPVSEYMKVECVILNYFKFNITLVTQAHICDLLMPLALDARERKRIGKGQRNLDVRENLNKLIKYFLDLSLQDDSLVDCQASKVAFAVLFCARSAFDLAPAWSEALKVFTGQTEDSFAFCVARLKVAACQISFATPPVSKRKKLRNQGTENRSRADGRSLRVSIDEGYGTPSTLFPVFGSLDSSVRRQQFTAFKKASVDSSKRNKKRLAAPQL